MIRFANPGIGDAAVLPVVGDRNPRVGVFLGKVTDDRLIRRELGIPEECYTRDFAQLRRREFVKGIMYRPCAQRVTSQDVAYGTSARWHPCS